VAKSPRILNPNYFARILLRDELRGMAAIACTSLGVDTRHPKREGMEYITLTPSTTVCLQKHYKGWTVPGKLYCVRCWRVQNGIPREIILRNWCGGVARPKDCCFLGGTGSTRVRWPFSCEGAWQRRVAIKPF